MSSENTKISEILLGYCIICGASEDDCDCDEEVTDSDEVDSSL